jgi:hypothetical protein
MPLLTKPGLIQLKIEDKGRLLTTQVNKINFTGSGVTTSVGEFNDITVLITGGGGATSSAFPYTGSAEITGSLNIIGPLSTTGTVTFTGLINQTSPQTHVVTFNNTTGQLYITASSAFGGGGGGGSTPGGNTNTIQYNNAGVLDGSDNFKLVGGNFVYLTGSLLVSGSTFFTGSVSSLNGFTGSLFGTSSWAVSASQAISSSYAFNATSASYALSSSQATSASYVDYNNIVEYSDLSRNTIASIKNVSGGTILKGTPCYVTESGVSGNLLGIFPADAGDPNFMPAGIISAQDLNNGDEGIGYIDGFINGVNTSAFNSGDEVYVAVGGGYTNVKPTGSALIQPLGYVEKVDPSNGSGLINGPGHYFEVPNITSGYTWIGNSDQVATPVSTASLYVISSSYSISSSQATSASYALSSSQAVSASYALSSSQALSSSFAVSASRAISSSFATSASYAPNTTFPYTGSAIISGSLTVTGSVNISENIVQATMTQEFISLPSGIGPGSTAVISKPLTGPISMFIEYQIVEGTNQRTGIIMANFNDAGTPTNTYSEMVTGDIGNTTPITFASSATTTPYEIIATNAGPNPYTFKAILKYY